MEVKRRFWQFWCESYNSGIFLLQASGGDSQKNEIVGASAKYEILQSHIPF